MRIVNTSYRGNPYFAVQLYFMGLKTSYRKYSAKSSILALQMKKHSKSKLVNEGNSWQYAYQRNRAKLSVIVLLYLFASDDQVITKKEMRVLKKFLKKESIYLLGEDVTFLYDASKKKPTLSFVMSFIRENTFKQAIFDESIKSIRELIKSNSDYLKLLSELHNAFKQETN